MVDKHIWPDLKMIQNSSGLKIIKYWYLDDPKHLLKCFFDWDSSNYSLLSPKRLLSDSCQMDFKKNIILIPNFLDGSEDIEECFIKLEDLSYMHNCIILSPFSLDVSGFPFYSLPALKDSDLRSYLNLEDSSVGPKCGSLKLYQMDRLDQLSIHSFLPREILLKIKQSDELFQLLHWNAKLEKVNFENYGWNDLLVNRCLKAEILIKKANRYSFGPKISKLLKLFDIRFDLSLMLAKSKEDEKLFNNLSKQKKYFVSILSKQNSDQMKLTEEELSNLTSSELKLIKEQLYSELDSISPKTKSIHDLILISYILGEKEESLKLSKKLFSQLPKDINNWSCSEREACLAAIQQFNRKQLFSESLSFCELYSQAFTEDQLLQLWIEQATALNGSGNIEKAKSIYDRVISKTNQTGQTKELSSTAKKARAMSFFQLGRLYGRKDETMEAIRHYGYAIEVLEELKNYYVISIALLNRAWIYLDRNELKRFEAEANKLKSIIAKHNFPHTKTGFYLINGIYLRKVRKYKASEESLVKAKQLAIEIGSRKSLEDVYVEILKLYSVQMRWAEIISLKEKLENSTEKISKNLKTFLQNILHEQTEEQLEGHYIEEYIFQPFGHAGCISKDQNTYPLQDFHSRVASILQNKKLMDLDKLEGILLHDDSISLDHFLFKLIKFKFSLKNPSLNISIDDLKASLMLIDNKKHYVSLFMPLIKHLEEEKNFLDSEVWMSQLNIVKYHFRPLVNFLFAGMKKAELRYESSGSITKSDKDVVLNYDIYIDETKREIFFNGKAFNELYSKKKSMKLLSRLLKTGSLTKSGMAKIIWSEEYDPMIHDSRIYTLVQRTKALIPIPEVIETDEGCYKLKPGLSFQLIEKQDEQWNRNATYQVLLENFQNNPEELHSKSQLSELVNSSDSTLKRELSKLVLANKIKKIGSGRSTKYQLAK